MDTKPADVEKDSLNFIHLPALLQRLYKAKLFSKAEKRHLTHREYAKNPCNNMYNKWDGRLWPWPLYRLACHLID